MHHARSRKGCLTCRAKKVKCDEQAPRCRRCHRLELKCDWAKPTGRLRPTAKAKPKIRPEYPKILPRSVLRAADLRHDQQEMLNAWPLPIEIPSLGPEQIHQPHEVLLDEASSDLSLSAFYDSSFAPAWGQWCHELGLFGSPLHAGNSTIAGETDDSPSGGLNDAALCPARDANSTMQVYWPLQPQDAISVPNLGSSWQNMVLSREFLRTGKEADALQYFTSHYPTMTISKTVRWSSYMIMLRHSSQEPMPMHLLIAASLMDLATSQDNSIDICRAAQAHAKAGMLLLKAAIHPDASHDPVSVIIASFFLYRYMALAQELDPLDMTQWSEGVFNYVKRNRLDNLCTGTRSAPANALTKDDAPPTAMTDQKKAHMARLMIWTFYEDIFASMKGYGGSLARHVCEKPEQVREIYQYSGAELESAWGEDYPEREILDDVENAPIITFLYDVMTLYAEVNRVIDSSPSSATDRAAVEDRIEKLEARSRSLIRLTTINVQPRSRVMLNADYMVPIFYALRIYCFRSFLSDINLAVPSPPVIQSCVTSILQLAQRSLSRGTLDPMRARFQWSLFMAGLETTDSIHKEWVQSKLKTAKMSIAFRTIICLEEETQRRAPMALIRQILGTKNSTLAI